MSDGPAYEALVDEVEHAGTVGGVVDGERAVMGGGVGNGVADSETRRLHELDRYHLWHPLTQHQAFQEGARPLIMSGGSGSVVWDVEGNEYLDAAAGLWCVNVGYGRQELVEAATRQMSQLAYYPLTQSHPMAIQLSEKLSSLLPHVPHIYYSNSGSEANELAFKVIRQYWAQRGMPGKVKILSRHRGYHGATLGALSATGQPSRKRGYEPTAPGFVQVSAPYCYRCPFAMSYPSCAMQCASDFERRIQIEDPDTVAAIIVEPVIAGGGVLVPPDDYLRAVSGMAKQHNVKLIVDEVVTGFGRTGSLFAHMGYGVVPDVVTMAKGLASGYMPIGATAFSEEIFSAFMGPPDSGRHLRHVNTYSGHPVATAVALANIRLIEEEHLVERSRTMGATLLAKLRAALGDVPWVGDVRGLGLLVGIELVQAGAAGAAGTGGAGAAGAPVPDSFMRAISKYLIAHGIIGGKTTDVEPNHNNILMFAPPLVITEDQVDQLVRTVRAAIVEVGSTQKPHSST
ncbi:MAG: aminotransferase [Firmicutes bacterium]|nr:aminotransferase [Bacillota bacterium]